jgi:HTH-type transcriptional regulator/antitoxin HigA
MNIRPIRSDADHRIALKEIERLWDAPEGSDDNDKLDILVTLVQRFEQTQWPVEQVQFDPVDVLHYAINEMGHTQAELSKILNSRSRASEILSRNRMLTVEMIRDISEAWKIPSDLLIKPYKATVAA